ncbi:MAG: GNAT family N-acetyltransferase [Sphingomonadaceae bacterium]|nr:GNAT family N-acetyltransferase [Sphingomonadaceae bacterium]
MTPAAQTLLSAFEGGYEDLDAIMVVMSESFDPEFGEAWSRSQCSGILAQPGVWISLICDGDEPAGFALARSVVDEAELLLIGVRPNFRGRGLGRKLLERTCATAAALGAKKLHLEMREGNDAEALYRMQGFEPVGRRKRYYRGQSGCRYDAITWSLVLG